MTIVQQLTNTLDNLDLCRDAANSPQEAREFSLAITAVEDAIMRTNLAWARRYGVYKVSDVQAGPVGSA